MILFLLFIYEVFFWGQTITNWRSSARYEKLLSNDELNYGSTSSTPSCLPSEKRNSRGRLDMSPAGLLCGTLLPSIFTLHSFRPQWWDPVCAVLEQEQNTKSSASALFAGFEECQTFGDHCKLVSWPSGGSCPGIVPLHQLQPGVVSQYQQTD